jgi:hypothetical protein
MGWGRIRFLIENSREEGKKKRKRGIFLLTPATFYAIIKDQPQKAFLFCRETMQMLCTL